MPIVTIIHSRPGVFPLLNPGIYDINLGNGSVIRLILGRCGHNGKTYVVIGLVGGGCTGFVRQVQPLQVKALLNCRSEDAGNLADFINCQFSQCRVRQLSSLHNTGAYDRTTERH